MSAKRVTIDALTRALCPSIDATLLPNAISSPSPSPGRVRVTRQQHGSSLSQRCCPNQARTAHTKSPARGPFSQKQLYPQWSARAAPQAPKRVTGRKADRAPRRPKDRFPTWARETATRPPEPEQGARPETSTELREPESTSPTVPELSKSLPAIESRRPQQKSNPKSPRNKLVSKRMSKDSEAAQPQDLVSELEHQASDKRATELASELANTATPVIYEALRRQEGHADGSEIQHLVKYLVEERGERPNVVLYQALAMANWHPTTGSAATLSQMFKEMATSKIGFSPGFFHSALRVCLWYPRRRVRDRC